MNVPKTGHRPKQAARLLSQKRVTLPHSFEENEKDFAKFYKSFDSSTTTNLTTN